MRLRGEGHYRGRGMQRGRGDAQTTTEATHVTRRTRTTSDLPSAPSTGSLHPEQPGTCPARRRGGKHHLVLVQTGRGQRFHQFLTGFSEAPAANNFPSCSVPCSVAAVSGEMTRLMSWSDRHCSGHGNSSVNVFRGVW